MLFRSAVRISLIFLLFLAGCGEVWNDPYPAAERHANILYSSFAERPKHLDPVQSYTEDEARFTQQVYEPPLQYHYLKRPYELAPLTAREVPAAEELEGGKFTRYTIRIRPGIRWSRPVPSSTTRRDWYGASTRSACPSCRPASRSTSWRNSRLSSRFSDTWRTERP